MVGVVRPQAPAQLHQLQKALVGILGVEEDIVDDLKVVAGPVAHQDVAVGVVNGNVEVFGLCAVAEVGAAA